MIFPELIKNDSADQVELISDARVPHVWAAKVQLVSLGVMHIGWYKDSLINDLVDAFETSDNHENKLWWRKGVILALDTLLTSLMLPSLGDYGKHGLPWLRFMDMAVQLLKAIEAERSVAALNIKGYVDVRKIKAELRRVVEQLMIELKEVP